MFLDLAMLPRHSRPLEEAPLSNPLRLLGITGSLRRGSYNTSLLRAAPAHLPEDVALTLRDLHGIPLYDGDVEAQGLPESVVAFREAIRGADGVLISTPEYNHGMPGVLKNAVDWASRGKDQPFPGKPVALVSASNGGFGGARSQIAWLPTLMILGARFMRRPEFYLSNAGAAFAPDGSLQDPRTREQFQKLLAAFATFTREALGR